MLEKWGVITAVMPTTEWSYEQPLPGGGTQRIPPKGCAGDDRNLIQQVKIFRVNINASLDNLEDDIATYIKTKSPMNNRFPGRLANPAHPTRIKRPFKPLIERIKDWLLIMQPKQPRLLIEDDAQRRGRICSKCPQNNKWKTGCLPCCDEVIQRGRHLRQRVDYPYADALSACRLHGFYLPSAVFIDRDQLGDEHAEAPAECWMKTEARAKQ